MRQQVLLLYFAMPKYELWICCSIFNSIFFGMIILLPLNMTGSYYDSLSQYIQNGKQSVGKSCMLDGQSAGDSCCN